ncbi:MAG: response regulator [Bacteroidales bacterium]|nr:response regulator [Bacteroidales bacterium]
MKERKNEIRNTILVVDDEPVNRLYFNALLEKLKYNVIEAENGKAAVEIYKNDQNIDLVIMDIKMPVMSGIEATRLIKNFDPEVPLIVVSAMTMAKEGVDAIEAGADRYLSKPVNREDFLSVVKSCMKSKTFNNEI